MASAGGAPSSGGRRKSLEAELNLVPFIDLLSTCICFLLMTVVWMEVGALQVKQAVGTEAPASNSKSMEMDVHYVSASKINVEIKGGTKKSQKFLVEAPNTDARLEKLGGILAGLPSMLKLDAKTDVKAQISQIFSVARVTTAVGVTYGELVSVMDVMRDHGLVNLGVVPVRK